MIKSRKRKRKFRRGAAVVEFAVCLPVIMLVVLGSIEAANMMFLRQAMIQTAYEGAKVAILRDAQNSNAISAANAVVKGRGLNGVSLTFDPEDISLAAPGETIRVVAFAPGDTNSLLPFGPFKNKIVSAAAVMIKE